jgi:hypothetical protein
MDVLGFAVGAKRPVRIGRQARAHGSRAGQKPDAALLE